MAPNLPSHLGVRQDDLCDAANDSDEVKDIPGVPEIILWEEGEGLRLGQRALIGAGIHTDPSRLAWHQEAQPDHGPGC